MNILALWIWPWDLINDTVRQHGWLLALSAFFHQKTASQVAAGPRTRRHMKQTWTQTLTWRQAQLISGKSIRVIADLQTYEWEMHTCFCKALSLGNLLPGIRIAKNWLIHSLLVNSGERVKDSALYSYCWKWWEANSYQYEKGGLFIQA
jgi:hypothetical protein